MFYVIGNFEGSKFAAAATTLDNASQIKRWLEWRNRMASGQNHGMRSTGLVIKTELPTTRPSQEPCMLIPKMESWAMGLEWETKVTYRLGHQVVIDVAPHAAGWAARTAAYEAERERKQAREAADREAARLVREAQEASHRDHVAQEQALARLELQVVAAWAEEKMVALERWFAVQHMVPPAEAYNMEDDLAVLERPMA